MDKSIDELPILSGVEWAVMLTLIALTVGFMAGVWLIVG